MPIDHSFQLEGGTTGILLIHGLSGTPHEMRHVAERLNRQGYTVSCPQLAGHCGTYDDLKAVRWQDWLASVERALLALGERCDKVIVGGLSTGAILSLHLAAKMPSRVHGLALLAPTLWLNGWMVPKHAYLFNLILQKAIANLFDFPDLHPHGIKNEAIRNQLKAAMAGADSSIAGNEITPGGAMIEHRWLVNSIRPRLRAIHQPTLIVYPRDDDFADLNNVAYLLRHLGSRIETLTLEDSYHNVTLDQQRDIVADRIASFVAQVVSEAKGHGLDARRDRNPSLPGPQMATATPLRA